MCYVRVCVGVLCVAQNNYSMNLQKIDKKKRFSIQS